MTRRPFRGVIWAVVGAILFFLFLYFLILPGYGVRWTGFGKAEVTKETTRFAATGEKTGTDLTVERQNERTIWDWVGLLGVGSAVAIVGYLFARHQRKRDEAVENERAQAEALQAFLDQMSDLMIVRKLGQGDKRPDSDPRRKVAQARTMLIFLALEEDNKRSPLRLVYELGLIGKDAPLISLRNASLRGAELSELALPEACLRHADLRTADLSGSNLRSSDLSEADLRGGQLINANLSGTDLTDANLLPYNARTPARLSIHNLKDEAIPSQDDLRFSRAKPQTTLTNLRNTNLDGADLSGALLANTDLTQVRGLTQPQINQAIGNEATKLPDHLEPPQNWEQSIEQQIAALLIPRLNDIKVRVNALVDSGTLTARQGDDLTTNLNTALQRWQDNETQAAINQLKEFTDQVKTLMRSNILTLSQGQRLVRQANGIVSIL